MSGWRDPVDEALVASSLQRRRRRRRRAIGATVALVTGVVAIGAGFGALVYAADRVGDGLALFDFDFPTDINIDLGEFGVGPETAFPPAAVPGRTLQWSSATARRFTAAPTVAEGRVFTRERGGAVVVYDQATGIRLWTTWVGSAPIGVDFPVQVLGGVAYVSGQQVHALDVATGAPRWTVAVPGAGGFPLTITDNDVFVDADTFTAMDRTTGAVRWTATIGNTTVAGYAQPATYGSTVFVGGGDGAVHALDRATGAVRWRIPIGNWFGAGAAPNVSVANGVVYASAPKVVQALDAGSGAVRWSHPVESDSITGVHPTIVGGLVVVAGRELRAIDASSGAGRWSRPLGATVFAFTPIPVDGLTAYVSAADGRLHAVDVVTGADVAVLGTEPPPLPGRTSLPTQAVPPAIADGVLYLASGDRHLYAYAP